MIFSLTAKPQLSWPLKSQQSGKFMHHSAKNLLGLDLLSWQTVNAKNKAIKSALKNIAYGKKMPSGMSPMFSRSTLIFQFQGKLQL